MPVKIIPVSSHNTASLGLEVSWDDGQFVMIVTPKGLVSCGVIDLSLMEKFGAAIAVARGTVKKPLVTVDDLLSARIQEVTEKAAQYGAEAGMTGAEALVRLS